MVLLAWAAAEESYFTQWRSFQREYRSILLSKAEDEASVKSARSFRIEIRQIVVPDLGNFDRCVTCHLGLDDPRMIDVPQPFRVHPEPFLDDHDVDKFGCVSCHLGQGRATTTDDAHGRVGGTFWEYPVLPAAFTQASCGVCHDPEHVGPRGAPLLAAGLELFRTQGCQGCHKLDGRGGPLGPPLDRVGDHGRHGFPFAHIEGEKQVWNWHVEHLRAPAAVVHGSKMPATDLGDEEIQGLAVYLMSLRTSNLTESLTPRDRYKQHDRSQSAPSLSGEELYGRFCFACHEEGGETVLHDTLGTIPSIRNPDFLAVVSRDFLARSIREGRPTTYMPAWGSEAGGLSETEILRLADHLLASRESIREITFEMAADADAENGEHIFRNECIDCHQLTAEARNAPSLGDPGFQSTYSDALIGHTIQFGREDTLMAPYGIEAGGDLDDKQVSDVVAFIRTLR